MMLHDLIIYSVVFQAFLMGISCENGGLFTLEGVRQHGVDFLDIAKAFALNSPKDLSLSISCAGQLNTLIQENEEVLFKMADAWSKFPFPGILYDSRDDYGHFDECVSIKVPVKDGDTILGKHCTYGLIIPDISLTNTTEMFEKGWKLSYCVPHLCTSDDLNLISQLPIFNDAICSTQESHGDLDTGAIVTISIFGIFGLLMALSTIYDIWFYKHDSKKSTFVLTAFSVYSNGKRLLTFVKHSKEQVLCFHGIKFISMWWIVSGHNAVSWLTYPVMNDQWRTDWQSKIYSQYLLTGHLAVDSFFFISGFLLAYLYFKNPLSKRPALDQIIAIPKMILHRYLRLTPALLMTFLFVVYVLRFMGDGPLFSYSLDDSLRKPCVDYWWAVFLYIQNYYIFGLSSEICITSFWYLSADMQLFLVAPLVIIPLAILNKKSFKIALAALFGINLLFVGLPIFTKLMWKSYDPDLSEFDAHSRLTDYFIGVMAGFAMRHETLRNLKISTRTNLITWFAVLAGMCGIIVGLQYVNINYGYVGKSLWYSFIRPLWCLGLAWVTLACFTGHGGFINWILSNKLMQLGSKLTYCIYLVHGPLIIYFTLIKKHRRLFTDYQLFYDWSGHLMISIVVATFWSLAFELPMLTIERLIFGRATPKGPTKTENK